MDGASQRDTCGDGCTGQPGAIAIHGGTGKVAVGLAAPGRVALVVVRALEALGVADHVAEIDAVAPHQPTRQLDRRAELAAVAEDLGVAEADVLDPDRRPVEADGVAAADAEPHELVDRAVAVDDEV